MYGTTYGTLERQRGPSRRDSTDAAPGAEQGPTVNVKALANEDYLEDELTISRVEPGRLWFDDEIGPVMVPRAVTDLTHTGWMVSLALSRVQGQWRLLQMGTVYPCWETASLSWSSNASNARALARCRRRWHLT